MTETELRNKVVAQARSWIGLKEDDGSFKPIIDRYNAITPLPAGYRMSYTDPWCAAFVSAVGAVCGLADIILPECSCDRMIALYKARGLWQEDDAYTAKPGDIIMYDWDDSGAGDCNGSADHVGIIVEVTSSGYVVVEGNKSDAVGYRSIQRNGRYIRGFATPDYAGKAGEGTPAEDKPGDTEQNGEIFAIRFRLLRYGCTGEDVRAVQRLLKAAGFDIGRYGADGDFGNDTRNAVVTYQKSVGLTANGEVGFNTMSRLLGRD